MKNDIKKEHFIINEIVYNNSLFCCTANNDSLLLITDKPLLKTSGNLIKSSFTFKYYTVKKDSIENLLHPNEHWNGSISMNKTNQTAKLYFFDRIIDGEKLKRSKVLNLLWTEFRNMNRTYSYQMEKNYIKIYNDAITIKLVLGNFE